MSIICKILTRFSRVCEFEFVDFFLKALLSIKCNINNFHVRTRFLRLGELGLLLLLKVLLSINSHVDNLYGIDPFLKPWRGGFVDFATPLFLRPSVR